MGSPSGSSKRIIILGAGLLLFAWAPAGATADTVVQGSNISSGANAVSGDASAANIASVQVGPQATSDEGAAIALQTGNNTVEIHQTAIARSGDAIAGSQVIGATDDDAVVMLDNISDGAGAASGDAGAANIAAVSGSSAGTTDEPASSDLVGDSSVAVLQHAESRTGDTAAGSQVHGDTDLAGALDLAATASRTGPPPVAWLAFVLLLTLMLLSPVARRPRAVRVSRQRSVDLGPGTMRVPAGWTSTRTPDGSVALFDPRTSGDGSIDGASAGILCRRGPASPEWARRVADQVTQDPSYRHLASGPAVVNGENAFRHEFEATVDGTPLRFVEHYVRTGDEFLRLTAYVPADSAATVPEPQELLGA